MIDGTPREHITLLWPEHLAHLAPEPSKMGVGEITAEGVVCNCGRVLGFPVVQDEAEYLASDQPGEEATPDEAGWNDLVTGEVEDPENPDVEKARKAKEYGNASTHPDGTWRCRYDGQTANDHPIEYPGQFHCKTPTPYVEPDKTTDSGPVDYSRPAEWDQPHAVGETVTVAGVEFTKHSESPFPEHNRDAQTGMSLDQAAAYERGEPAPPPAVRMPDRDAGVVEAQDPITARVVVIDPTLPYGPQDVEHQLLDINGRIERGVHFQRYWEERHYEAKTTYDLSWARATVNSRGGAADMRKAEALLACEEQYRELELCNAMVKAVRETMHNLRSLQSGYQTVSRSVSDSMRMPNTRP